MILFLQSIDFGMLYCTYELNELELNVVSFCQTLHYALVYDFSFKFPALYHVLPYIIRCYHLPVLISKFSSTRNTFVQKGLPDPLQ
jgi:hypothetical protein